MNAGLKPLAFRFRTRESLPTPSLAASGKVESITDEQRDAAAYGNTLTHTPGPRGGDNDFD